MGEFSPFSPDGSEVSKVECGETALHIFDLDKFLEATGKKLHFDYLRKK